MIGPIDDELDDSEQRQARIARPTSSPYPALTLRGLNLPTASTSASATPAASPNNATPENEMQQGAQASRGLMSTGIAKANATKPSALDTRKLGDETELNRLQGSPSGIGKIQKNHPILGGVLRGLETVGDVLSPGTMAMIPGTGMHHSMLENQARHRVGEDVAQQGKEAATGKTQADTEEAEARTGLVKAQTDTTGQPKAKEEKWDTFPGYTDIDGTPLIREENSGQVVRANDKRPATGFKAADLNKETPAHITYDSGIPVTVVDPHGKVYDVNDPKLPPELKPLVDAANRAHGTHVTEETDKEARAASAADQRATRSADTRSETVANKRYETALDADQRLARMESAYQKGLKGDQQAMLSLLTDHIGMTLGMQKGARITKDILNEAQQSQPWLAKIESKFDQRGYLSGVTLGPDQMRQMLELGYGARDRAVQGAYDASELYGVQPPKGASTVFGKRKLGEMPALQEGQGGNNAPAAKTGGPPAGATMKVPGSDGKLHWSDGKQDLGVVQ